MIPGQIGLETYGRYDLGTDFAGGLRQKRHRPMARTGTIGL